MRNDFSVDIQFLGDKELEAKLRRLSGPEQRRAVISALRASAKRTMPRLIHNISGNPVKVRTGRLVSAFLQQSVKSEKSDRNLIRLGIPFPTRDQLGISADDPYYYPTAVEFGHPGAPAHPYARPAVDDHKSDEIRLIGAHVGKRIEQIARKR